VLFSWYGRQHGRVLKCFTRFYVQNEKSRELLATIGITNVTVSGDTRFDRVLQIKEAAKVIPEIEQLLGANHPKVFVAGSSWPPDEEIFIRYFKEHKDWKLIIAPHVIGEDHLQQIEKLLEGRKVVRLSKKQGMEDGEVLIIDCFGLLSSIYRYATVCYVGGGFGVSIHNTLEAAVWGRPVIFGPENKKFQEAQGLKACGGGFEIQGYDDFKQLMDCFDGDATSLAAAGEKAGAYVESLTGATGIILADVERHIAKGQ
jgi:3-deoxy-D-manno-octulosonic-acid transferase